MFPAGLPGLALLLLRASVAVAALAETYAHRQDLNGWMQAAAIPISLAVSVGYLTPLAAVIGLVFHGLIWYSLGVDGVVFAIIISLDASALALLGPGAFSLDSYLFGRRVVVLPPP
jgi:hypothetical protein